MTATGVINWDNQGYTYEKAKQPPPLNSDAVMMVLVVLGAKNFAVEVCRNEETMVWVVIVKTINRKHVWTIPEDKVAAWEKEDQANWIKARWLDDNAPQEEPTGQRSIDLG